MNEINNKVKELRKLDYYLRESKDLDPSLLPQLRKYLNENMLGQDKSSFHPTSFSDDKVFIGKPPKTKVSDKDMIKIYKKKVEQCIQKINTQKSNKITDIEATKQKTAGKRIAHKKQFFFKQLADIVESVTGASAVACGLNLT